jgi:hypothetical protein
VSSPIEVEWLVRTPTTDRKHQMALYIEKGMHLLVLVDDEGNRLEQHFEVLDK